MKLVDVVNILALMKLVNVVGSELRQYNYNDKHSESDLCLCTE